ncbi:MAG: NAD-dependent epimerase/dehydratase family protein [Sphingobium sp.]
MTMPNISGGKFIVVGGASLLGSHIGGQLLDGGAREVVLLDNLALGSTDNIGHLLQDSRCSFVRGDILRLNELYDPFDKADGIFAVAGFLAAPIMANPWMGIDVNTRGLQNVMEAARYQSVKKVVFSSSVGVYGAVGEEPNSETSPLRWEGMAPGVIIYCASKILGEGIGRLYEQHHGIEFVGLRYSAIYGERLHKRALDATRMVEAYEAVRAGRAPVIDGDGAGVQDYVYVGDVARANLMAMESAASGEGINVVSGEDTSQRQIVEYIIAACGSSLKPEFRDDPARLRMPTSAKQGFSREKAKRLIGWEPEVSIAEGIKRLVKWLDEQHAGAS